MDKPTREPIADFVPCDCRCHSGFSSASGCKHCTAPQPTAQAGEACNRCGGDGKLARMDMHTANYKWIDCPDCSGTGKVPAPPKEHLKAREPYKGSSVDFGSHRKPKAAPPTPSAGETPWQKFLRINDFDGSNLNRAQVELAYKEFNRPTASPQLPTPEQPWNPDLALEVGMILHGYKQAIQYPSPEGFTEADCEDEMVEFVRKRDALQAKAADERFEAALEPSSRRTAPAADAEEHNFDYGYDVALKDARSRWYAPTPKQENEK